MLYTEKEVLDYVREEDVKFVRLAFCDIFGAPKNISVLAGELDEAFKGGVAIDPTAIRGFERTSAQLFLHPDPQTLSVLPWRPSHGRVVRMYCNIKYADGAPFELDNRHILQSAVETAGRQGVKCRFGSKNEFYLFKTGEQGEHTKIPLDRAGYMDMAPGDAGENVRREICLTLEEMGLCPQASHHEEGPGQNEIDFRSGEPLSSADDNVTFKTVVKTVAVANGLWADFSPKPLPSEAGNGMHISILPQLDGQEGLFMSFMAGVLRRIREMTVFLNPLATSYDRLGSYKAPGAVDWSDRDLSRLISIPAKNRGLPELLLRSPDPMANPYIAYALILAAGAEGVKEKLTPPEAFGQGGEPSPLPVSLEEAARLALESGFIRSCLPQSIIEDYTNTSR